MTEPQENQQELFQEFSGDPSRRPERFPSLQKTQKPILFTTNIEQLILAVILLVLSGCFVFFLGILRGRAIAPHERNISAPRLPRPAAPMPVSVPAPIKVFSAPPAVANTTAQKAMASPLVLDETKPYTIQLVTHKKKVLAEKEVASLRRNGHLSWIIPSGEYHQVCAGQYRDREDAKKALRLFSSKYKDCFLRRR